MEREMPRGTVDWNCYAGRALPTGRWTSFQCSYSELSGDPELVAALRWTCPFGKAALDPYAFNRKQKYFNKSQVKPPQVVG